MIAAIAVGESQLCIEKGDFTEGYFESGTVPVRFWFGQSTRNQTAESPGTCFAQCHPPQRRRMGLYCEGRGHKVP
jgi:hypothetical protein